MSVGTVLDEQFDHYLNEVDLYGLGWWQHDEEPQRSRLAACPGLYETLHRRATAGHVIETTMVYRDAVGWDSGRRQLHRELLDSVVPPTDERSGAGEPPVCFLTLGVPGSGKTRLLRRVLRACLDRRGHMGSTRVCDADDLRVRFPEYHGGRGSMIVQKELARVVYDDEDDPLGGDGPSAQQRVLRVRGPGTALVIDTIGSVEHTPPIAEQIAAAGGEVHVLAARVPVEEAVRRAKQRALETGRIVPPEVIEAAGDRPEAALEACVAGGHVSAYAVLDTSGPPDAAPLVLATDGHETYGRVGEPVVYW
jgi:hypothetical protein